MRLGKGGKLVRLQLDLLVEGTSPFHYLHSYHIKKREVSTMSMIRKMKNRVIRDHGFESGVTISFFRACDEYQDGLMPWKELQAIYMRAIGG